MSLKIWLTSLAIGFFAAQTLYAADACPYSLVQFSKEEARHVAMNTNASLSNSSSIAMDITALVPEFMGLEYISPEAHAVLANLACELERDADAFQSNHANAALVFVSPYDVEYPQIAGKSGRPIDISLRRNSRLASSAVALVLRAPLKKGELIPAGKAQEFVAGILVNKRFISTEFLAASRESAEILAMAVDEVNRFGGSEAAPKNGFAAGDMLRFK